MTTQICFVALLVCAPQFIAGLKMTPDALDEVGKDPWSGLTNAENAVEKGLAPSSFVEESAEEAEEQSEDESTAVATQGKARRGGAPARASAKAGDILAMQKAFEQITNLLTKPSCQHFAKVIKAKKAADLVKNFDIQCKNIMNHRRGLVGEKIVGEPVGKLACRHTHAYLSAMEKPKDASNASDGEMCGVYQEMVSSAVAHLSQEDKLSESLEEVGKANKKKAGEAKKRQQKKRATKKQ